MELLQFLQGNWLSLWVLLGIIAIVYIFDRKKFRREATLLYLRRTKRGLSAVDKFGRAHKRFFRIFGEVGIVLSFGALGLLYLLREKKFSKMKIVSSCIAFAAASIFLLNYVFTTQVAIASTFFGAAGLLLTYLGSMIYGVLSGAVTASAVQIVAPFEIQGAPVFYVPLDFFLISLVVLIVAHELSHAFVARAQGIKVKSLGYGFLAILPLAFAEPDERQMKKEKGIKRARIFASGSLSNVVVGLVSALLLVGVVLSANAVFTTTGAEYKTTLNGTPAQSILPKTGTITAINNVTIDSINDLSNTIGSIKANETIKVTVNGHAYSIKTTSNPENSTMAYMGVSQISNRVEIKNSLIKAAGIFSPLTQIFWSLIYLAQLLRWLFMLNIGVGLMNLLPIKPLDGGLMLEEILNSFAKKRVARKIYKIVATLTLFLIFASILGPYFMMLF